MTNNHKWTRVVGRLQMRCSECGKVWNPDKTMPKSNCRTVTKEYPNYGESEHR